MNTSMRSEYVIYRKAIILILTIALIICTIPFSEAAYAASKPEKGSTVWYSGSNNLSSFDFSNDRDLVLSYDFGDKTIWPSSSKMPKGLDVNEVLEWAKYPGLGMDDLHALGYTGKGVNVSYADQPLGKATFAEYKNVDLHYDDSVVLKYKQYSDAEMHGSAVLSLIAGKNIGIAPEASVFFEANPAWLADQRTHAECIEKIIELNKTLPSNKKIKVLGFSDNIDSNEKNPEAFEAAVRKAESSGIHVIFANYGRAKADLLTDRDNFENYSIASNSFGNNGIVVPTDRTTAAMDNCYVRWNLGGTSWTTPQIVGLMAIGWQINPNLSAKQLEDIIYNTGYPLSSVGRLMNPKAFVKGVKDTLNDTKQNYTIFIYNSDNLTQEDKMALDMYMGGSFPIDMGLKYIDAKNLNTAEDVFKAIRKIENENSGKLKGIQIFGIANDVPAFKVRYEAKMVKGEVDKGGIYLSDYFYGNTDNDVSIISNFSVYDAFEKGKNVSWLQKYPVARLPITKGDYKAYFDKVTAYSNQVKKQGSIPLINYSNPIFNQKNHSDDMGYFIAKRIDKEFGILSSKQYKLYGVTKGDNPLSKSTVSESFLGDVTKETLKKENSNGITDILVNSHGQKTNADKVWFDNGKEVRESLFNTQNVNSILNSNYYNYYGWNCNQAYDLDKENLAYAMIAKGNAITAFSATTIISNNGVNNKASLDKMKANNFYYFYYNFMKNYYGGKSRSDSFYLAMKEYTSEILKHTGDNYLMEGNYQFNLNNVLTYEYLGLLSIQESGKANISNSSTLTKPEKVSNVKLSTDSKKIFASWRQVKSTGYQVQIATNKSFTKNKKTYKIKKSGATDKTITGLTNGKTYYVRVRAFSTLNSKTKYGKWSTIKSIKVKKKIVKKTSKQEVKSTKQIPKNANPILASTNGDIKLYSSIKADNQLTNGEGTTFDVFEVALSQLENGWFEKNIYVVGEDNYSVSYSDRTKSLDLKDGLPTEKGYYLIEISSNHSYATLWMDVE